LTIPTLDASIGTLFALLPGVLAYVIIRALCNRSKKIEIVELTAFSLTYTVIIQALWQLIEWSSVFRGANETVGLTVVALFVALIFSLLYNSGISYKLIAMLRLSSEMAWPTAWETVFRTSYSSGFEYAVLELRDGRRIMGAVRYYDSTDDNDYVGIENASWLVDEQDSVPVDAPGILLFARRDLMFVQFLPNAVEAKHDQQPKPKP
jgi:hypothetical protein